MSFRSSASSLTASAYTPGSRRTWPPLWTQASGRARPPPPGGIEEPGPDPGQVAARLDRDLCGPHCPRDAEAPGERQGEECLGADLDHAADAVRVAGLERPRIEEDGGPPAGERRPIRGAGEDPGRAPPQPPAG